MQIDAHKSSGPGETPRRPRSRAPLLPPSQTSASHKKNSKLRNFTKPGRKSEIKYFDEMLNRQSSSKTARTMCDQ